MQKTPSAPEPPLPPRPTAVAPALLPRLQVTQPAAPCGCWPHRASHPASAHLQQSQCRHVGNTHHTAMAATPSIAPWQQHPARLHRHCSFGQQQTATHSFAQPPAAVAQMSPAAPGAPLPPPPTAAGAAAEPCSPAVAAARLPGAAVAQSAVARWMRLPHLRMLLQWHPPRLPEPGAQCGCCPTQARCPSSECLQQSPRLVSRHGAASTQCKDH